MRSLWVNLLKKCETIMKNNIRIPTPLVQVVMALVFSILLFIFSATTQANIIAGVAEPTTTIKIKAEEDFQSLYQEHLPKLS